MKHIQKSQEPPKLNEYRQNNPNRKWENFRHDCQSGLEEVYVKLLEDQGGLCVYCEMKISKPNHQVEHFHDKSDDSDPNAIKQWHLDWNNMWYACMGGTKNTRNTAEYMLPIKDNCSCGQHKKKDDYKTIFPPQKIPAFPRLFTYKNEENGISIHADEKLCIDAKIEPQQIEHTIDVLNLNCKRLCAARWAIIKPIYKRLENIQKPFEQYKPLIKIFMGNKYKNGLWESFFTMIRWRFGEAAEEYLEEIQFHG
ncbi:MAG: TIGR02646 family protein [Planctomycetaceae bacterium]|jgi:uncharacterized protein (TIGR02646 family)|nr:TIGR02646 family protein [Planctomycetaceae bacterium]